MLLTQGVFPKELKIAKVVSIYKSGDGKIINNYRPVSLFKHMMYSRMFYFLNSFNLLCKYQFGFREQYGTNMVLFVLVDKILKAIDEGNIIPGMYLDLNKAFDTVDHPI